MDSSPNPVPALDVHSPYSSTSARVCVRRCQRVHAWGWCCRCFPKSNSSCMQYKTCCHMGEAACIIGLHVSWMQGPPRCKGAAIQRPRTCKGYAIIAKLGGLQPLARGYLAVVALAGLGDAIPNDRASALILLSCIKALWCAVVVLAAACAVNSAKRAFICCPAGDALVGLWLKCLHGCLPRELVVEALHEDTSDERSKISCLHVHALGNQYDIFEHLPGERISVGIDRCS